MSYQVEVAEALCSAFYKMPFVEFLGETDDRYFGPAEQTARYAYFHFGEKPKDMRVTVIRPSKNEHVEVRVEWRNYFADGRNPLKGEQSLRVSTYAADQRECFLAAEQVAQKVLTIFEQVLSEEGVAGKIADLVEADDSHGVNEE